MSEREKVLFVQKNDEGDIEIEGIWCIKSGEYYIVDNIPFVAKRIALGDTIKVELDEEEQAYYFDDFIEVSGNTTVRVYFENSSFIESTRNHLNKLGCESEAFLSKSLIAVNVPKKIDYKPIKDYLDEGEKLEKWQYEESCLSHEY